MAFGTHFTDTLNGAVFSQAATPAGLALPIYTATSIGGGIPLWNPPNSNRNIELISVDFPWVSGTAGIGTIGLMALLGLGAIATGTPCTALAATTPNNGFIGGGQASKALSSNAGTTTVTAGTAGAPTVLAPGWVRALASINLENSTTTPQATNLATYTFNGTIIIPPSVLMYFACSVATVALYGTTVVWKEIPINPAQG
jgi:hypothetical protein